MSQEGEVKPSEVKPSKVKPEAVKAPQSEDFALMGEADLLSTPREKKVIIEEPNKGVIIRAIGPHDIGSLYTEAEKSGLGPEGFALMLVQRSVVKPTLTLEKIKSMKISVFNKLVPEVMELSGLPMRGVAPKLPLFT